VLIPADFEADNAGNNNPAKSKSNKQKTQCQRQTILIGQSGTRP